MAKYQWLAKDSGDWQSVFKVTFKHENWWCQSLSSERRYSFLVILCFWRVFRVSSHGQMIQVVICVGPKFTNSAVEKTLGAMFSAQKSQAGPHWDCFFRKVSKGRGGFGFRSKAMLHCTDCLVVVYDMHSLPCSLPTSLDDSLITTLITAAQWGLLRQLKGRCLKYLYIFLWPNLHSFHVSMSSFGFFWQERETNLDGLLPFMTQVSWECSF